MCKKSRIIYWGIVWCLYVILTGVTCREAWRQYYALESGWSWDLAYYNQWFWAVCFGDETLSVRPIASYATEGPSVWKMNYLSPLRFCIIPIYYLRPDPTTLLYINCIFFWLLIPASAKLLIDETGAVFTSLMALILVPLAPLLRPLAVNDFREMQIAIPFAIIAVNGWRMRQKWWLVIGIAGLLFCRQEWAMVIPTLAIIPAKHPESIDKTYNWRIAVIFSGLIWFCAGFLVYLRLNIGRSAPQHFMNQFGGQKPPVIEIIKTTWDFLWVGLSAWILIALFAPRVALTALPWVWTLASGKWAIRFVGSEQWHHARYCVPFVVMGLAAGMIGWGNIVNWCQLHLSRFSRKIVIGGVWLVWIVFLCTGQIRMATLLKGIPERVPDADIKTIWYEMQNIRPEDGVVAPYELTAPLSSRRYLFSYVMDVNKP
ncbi:MAG: hypothetical protein ACKO85_13865, partial [Isosphaeraceae bacterium]